MLKHHPQGQGLLETVVALGVISVGLIAAITLATTSFTASREGAHRLVVVNLAREGVEVVRNIRDTEVMNRRDPTNQIVGVADDHTFVPVFNPQASSWTLNFTPDKITEDGAKVRATSDGLLLQGDVAPATPTVYARLVTASLICRSGTGERVVSLGPCSGTETRIGFDVQSEVSWRTGDQTRSLIVEEKLYDWR